MVEGAGTMTYKETGNTYTGSWQRGVRHGRGVLRLKSGSVYDGSFDAGMIHGRGLFRYHNGGCSRLLLSFVSCSFLPSPLNPTPPHQKETFTKEGTITGGDMARGTSSGQTATII